MEHLMKEAIRYLGYGKHAVDDNTRALILESFADLQQTAERKSIYRIFSLKNIRNEESETSAAPMFTDKICIGTLEVESKNLSKNLKGCEQAVIFGATLGIGVDRLIQRTSITNMAKAVVLQACAAAYLEEYCDACQDEIGRELQKEGKYLRPRFSPGYGDFPLFHQRQLLRMIDSAKTIGLTMTDSYLMTPTKSVSAVIGVSSTHEPCHRQGCEVCEKRDCPYRRDTL